MIIVFLIILLLIILINFLTSNNKYAITIGNTENLDKLLNIEKKINNFKIVSIMTTLEENKELELISLKSQLSKYFQKDALLKRFEIQSFLINERFFKKKYSENINLHFIKRKDSIFQYIIKLNNYIEYCFNDNIILNEELLKIDIESFSKLNDFYRTIK